MKADVAAADVFGVLANQCSAQSPHGVMAAAAPRAALAGATMLELGGNAYDAVVAAALAETVLLPPKCGLAGDLVAMVWPAGAEPSALISVGRAGGGLAEAATSGRLSETGPMSVGAPGAPAGYLALAQRARFDLAELARPAIDLATEGFCWSDICATLGQESADLVARYRIGDSHYFPGGIPLASGEVVTLPGLASALEHFSAERHDFLQGPVGRAIIGRVTAAGGVLTLDDLGQDEPEWVETESVMVGEVELHATPAPTHGLSLLEAVTGSNGARRGGEQDLYLSVMAAINRRRDQLADPSGTSMVSAVDGDGTLAVVIHSNSFPRFGSGLMVDEFDLVLSNRAGRGFSPEPGHPNFPTAGRRPATTLHAWAMASADGHHLLGATPGGANQMPWNAQSIRRLLAGAAPVEAVLAPRWEWRPVGDGVVVEAALEPELLAELEQSAPSIETVGLWKLRSAMQIVSRHRAHRAAVVDPRTQGAVIGL